MGTTLVLKDLHYVQYFGSSITDTFSWSVFRTHQSSQISSLIMPSRVPFSQDIQPEDMFIRNWNAMICCKPVLSVHSDAVESTKSCLLHSHQLYTHKFKYYYSCSICIHMYVY